MARKSVRGISLIDCLSSPPPGDLPVLSTSVPGTPTAEPDALAFLESAPTVCLEPTCTRRATHRGRCMPHYMRYCRALKDPQRAVKLKVDNTLAAKQYLKSEAFEAAKVLMAGARVAARKGDTRPAEWILLHTRSVEPVNKDGDIGPRVVVQVGVALPGLGSQPGSANLPGATVSALPPVSSELTE